MTNQIINEWGIFATFDYRRVQCKSSQKTRECVSSVVSFTICRLWMIVGFTVCSSFFLGGPPEEQFYHTFDGRLSQIFRISSVYLKHYRVTATISGNYHYTILQMWVKQYHTPPIWEWFIPSIYGDLGDDLLLFYIVLTT